MKRASSAKTNSKKMKHESEERIKSSTYFDDCNCVFEKFLGNDISLKDFKENYWEKKPLIIRRNDNLEWLNFIKSLFSLELLKSIVKEKKPVYELDVNLCKLVKGKKKVFNKNGVVKLDHLEKSFDNDKTTIQFHQPQRFSVSF
jgi:ribosomal protein L16 Arg81 hydroxylase